MRSKFGKFAIDACESTVHCKEMGGAGAYVLVRHISIVGLPNNFYASAY